jgi:hypothetical protein
MSGSTFTQSGETVTTRALVRKADGSWGGAVDATGQPTAYGLPVKWRHTDATWHTVTNYDRVYWWNGSVWVPWSSNMVVTPGTPMTLNPGAAPGVASATVTLPAGDLQLVFWAAGGNSILGSAPADVSVSGTLNFQSSPTWPMVQWHYGNCGGWQGAMQTCTDSSGHTNTSCTSQVNPAGVWVSAGTDPASRVASPSTAWKAPAAPDVAGVQSTSTRHLLIPVGIKGASSVQTVVASNCWPGATDPLGAPTLPANDPQHQVVMPGVTLTRPGTVLRLAVGWGNASGAPVAPGAFTDAAGALAGYATLWDTTYVPATAGKLALRVKLWSAPAGVGSVPDVFVASDANLWERLGLTVAVASS